MSALKSVYNVFRSLIMSLIVLLVVAYVALYVVLSVPSVQRKVKERVSAEVSAFLGGSLDIRSLTVRPFSEVMLEGVSLDSPDGNRCVYIGKVAAGIDLWSLVSDRRIVLNYAEIIGLDAEVVQAAEGEPLNIQFIIDALSPKDKDKPSAEFDLKFRNVVVRDSKASFSRLWMVDAAGDPRRFADIDVSGLRIDLSIPELRNDVFRFDVRNIRFDVSPGVSVRGLSCRVAFEKASSGGTGHLNVSDFHMAFPNSVLEVGDIGVDLDSLQDIKVLINGRLTPSDFVALMPQLESFGSPWELALDSSVGRDSLSLSKFTLRNLSEGSEIDLRASAEGYAHIDSLDLQVERLKADINPKVLADVVDAVPSLGHKAKDILLSVGPLSVDLKGKMQKMDVAEVTGMISSAIGAIELSASGSRLSSSSPRLGLVADLNDLEVGKLLGSADIGSLSADIEAEVVGFDRHAQGQLHLKSDHCVIKGNLLSSLHLDVERHSDEVAIALDALSEDSYVAVDAHAYLSGPQSQVSVDAEISGINPSRFGMKGKMADCEVSARFSAETRGDSPDNLTGKMDFRDIALVRPDGSSLRLPLLSIDVDSLSAEGADADTKKPLPRLISIDSDWLEARLEGSVKPASLIAELKSMTSSVFPTLLTPSATFRERGEAYNDFSFDILIKGASAPYAFFDTPLRPLADIPVSGAVDASGGKASFAFATPHLQQGGNKLIRDVDFKLDLDAFLGMAKVNGTLIFPAKKGDAQLASDVFAARDKVNVNLDINPSLESSVKGSVGMAASFSRIPDPFRPDGILAVRVDFLPSAITVNDKVWNIAEGGIDYAGKRVAVSHFQVSHDEQFVSIDGTASESPNDEIKVRLNDIDLDYIFNILNINYVSFGGMASGEVSGSRLLTKLPDARTEYLRVKGLSYNGAVLGDADLASEYDARAQKVGIYAVVRDPLTRKRKVSVDGGIWVTRDSLSFGFDADKVNVGIMKPFVSAFCSDLYGEASGRCRLYGTFSDIDLVGGLRADTLSMKLDFTNTWYHAGNDSVFLKKGLIDIPPLTLYDSEGHTAEFSGWLKHTYFHDPVFSFRLRDAVSLLCYDTDEKINPLWYGTIYGSGHAQINGAPGLIDIDMNMTTEEGSRFCYVISDAEDVAQYSFLTFTDRRKESREAGVGETIPDYLKRFRKSVDEQESASSNVLLSLKGTVTNDALVTLVMDPRAGDNITARGQGALQMDYNMASNDLRMIGTYVLDEGNYNFTLQDIIIKNFNIRKGSLIKFDGDPMKAMLDIAATYRVNTNLTDLDKSFSTDRELNRTNVPVDAVLLVDGPMTDPDISFDIELPSLTSDVERKVKSIVSTNDMMSRQIIYLLALNRFYTPEYTGGQNSSGSEWSSMASSTISSQLSNILSQMTDKVDLAPSFRSDKGDFSDMEFDLALSSRLLNNRLLINGNFGYRDKNTSNTQFVGDFDIEYLLSKNGNLRLKAYNHFNDQNYYLRSALTTQGVGVVFRKDFDRLFRRRKDGTEDNGEQPSDSVPGRGIDSVVHGPEEMTDSLNNNDN